MRLQRWLESQDLQDAWRSTWNTPHMNAGFDVLQIEAAHIGFIVPADTDALTAGALRNAARQGALSMLALIQGMGEPPQKGSPDPAPAYSLEEEMERDSPLIIPTKPLPAPKPKSQKKKN